MASFEDLSPDNKKNFDNVLKLAFQSTVIEAQQVLYDDIQNFFKFNKQSSNDEVFLGLVVADQFFVKYGLKEIYTFLNYTLQEYLAACHIVQLSFQEQTRIISECGGDNRLEVVKKFYREIVVSLPQIDGYCTT